MSKHTQGPWRTGTDFENAGGGLNVVATINGHSIHVAHTNRSVFGGKEYVSESEAIANGHLVSAAPEMYVALRALLEQMPPAADDAMCHRGICSREECKHCGRVDAATRAIAKAEARS